MASEHFNHLPDSIINRITEAEINCGKLFGMLSKQILTLEKRIDDLHYRLEKNEVLVELVNKHCACPQELIESDKLSCMAKKSRNNRRKTAGKFTTNPTQYLPLCNLAKYNHTYDRTTGLITVKNKRQDRIGRRRCA